MVLPSMRLDDKVVLVTGAGSGIGRAIAIAVAEAGADVAVCEMPQKVGALDEVCEAIENLGQRALPLALQLPDQERIDAAVSRVIDTYGRVDGLVNNAGVNIPKDALEVTEADWDGVLDVNYEGVVFYVAARGAVG